MHECDFHVQAKRNLIVVQRWLIFQDLVTYVCVYIVKLSRAGNHKRSMLNFGSIMVKYVAMYEKHVQ